LHLKKIMHGSDNGVLHTQNTRPVLLAKPTLKVPPIKTAPKFNPILVSRAMSNEKVW